MRLACLGGFVPGGVSPFAPFRLMPPCVFSRSDVSGVGILGVMGPGGHSWGRVFPGLVYLGVLVSSGVYKQDF